ncbi:hypothetical protein [uncultured Kiloniella sp.]|uniref:hypothetical protein n=1 Tax=uncultured Kiloniella sp. TaxID=1133091 RepID=UPI00261965B3|nr:hypothetical protein [uncultured Kiloniella sp.]
MGLAQAFFRIKKDNPIYLEGLGHGATHWLDIGLLLSGRYPVDREFSGAVDSQEKLKVSDKGDDW